MSADTIRASSRAGPSENDSKDLTPEDVQKIIRAHCRRPIEIRVGGKRRSVSLFEAVTLFALARMPEASRVLLSTITDGGDDER